MTFGGEDMPDEFDLERALLDAARAQVAQDRRNEPQALVLRSVGWDGPTPQRGDMLVDPDGHAARIERVAEGPGCGQWRLEVVRCSSFRWSTPLEQQT